MKLSLSWLAASLPAIAAAASADHEPAALRGAPATPVAADALRLAYQPSADCDLACLWGQVAVEAALMQAMIATGAAAGQCAAACDDAPEGDVDRARCRRMCGQLQGARPDAAAAAADTELWTTTTTTTTDGGAGAGGTRAFGDYEYDYYYNPKSAKGFKGYGGNRAFGDYGYDYYYDPKSAKGFKGYGGNRGARKGGRNKGGRGAGPCSNCPCEDDATNTRRFASKGKSIKGEEEDIAGITF